ncbi:MAG: hypothetical protein ACQEQE_09175 [Bacillota bacterium]
MYLFYRKLESIWGISLITGAIFLILFIVDFKYKYTVIIVIIFAFMGNLNYFKKMLKFLKNEVKLVEYLSIVILLFSIFFLFVPYLLGLETAIAQNKILVIFEENHKDMKYDSVREPIYAVFGEYEGKLIVKDINNNKKNKQCLSSLKRNYLIEKEFRIIEYKDQYYFNKLKIIETNNNGSGNQLCLIKFLYNKVKSIFASMF